MKWRTDKPTADVIVAYVRALSHLKESISPCILYKLVPTGSYIDSYCRDIPFTHIVKWADLKEEETVTDCHQLESSEILTEEVKRLGWSESVEDCNDFHLTCEDGAATINDVFDLASHFVKWGAEHLKKIDYEREGV